MGEVINLRLARKARRRAEAEAEAQASRAAHGRTKADRDLVRQETTKAARHLDGHKRDDVP